MSTRVQYSHPQREINITTVMTPPKNISSIDAWFKAARKAIPKIPHQGWYVHTQIANLETILYELIHRQTHERCAVIIKRK